MEPTGRAPCSCWCRWYNHIVDRTHRRRLLAGCWHTPAYRQRTVVDVMTTKDWCDALLKLIGRSLSNCVQILRRWFGAYRWRWKCSFKIQDGGSRHLQFWKMFAVSLLLDRSSPNLEETSRLRFRTHLLHWKCIVVKIQNDGLHRPEFRKTVSSLYNLTK